MKARLLADGYIEVESETEEERQVLNVMADEGIDLAQMSSGRGVTTLQFRRSYYATLQANAAEDFRDDMLAQVYAMNAELQKLQAKLESLWGPSGLPEADREPVVRAEAQA